MEEGLLKHLPSCSRNQVSFNNQKNETKKKRQRHDLKHMDISLQKKKGDKSEPSSSREFQWVDWLVRFAEKTGDSMPFGDGNNSSMHQLRIPFYTKKQVWEIYCQDYQDEVSPNLSVGPQQFMAWKSSKATNGATQRANYSLWLEMIKPQDVLVFFDVPLNAKKKMPKKIRDAILNRLT
mmetsp:Transcript_27411/g.43147  ORF Transcript_27411/g.43147 Transcript_27411/m.43147 type:complete len:179 (-) Transcript_27411:103-639(-)